MQPESAGRRREAFRRRQGKLPRQLPRLGRDRIWHLYSKTPHHDLRDGLLLRRDLHPLFDAGLIAINSNDWMICVSPALDRFEEIRQLRGTRSKSRRSCGREPGS
jgi:hypothetical protein